MGGEHSVERKVERKVERGVRADARANRHRIVAAARELYAEQGVDVSFNAIAQRAGVGNATLYRHFRTQEALRDAVYRLRIQEISDRLDELALLRDPAVEMRRLLSWLFETADLSLIGVAAERSSMSVEATAEAAALSDRLDHLVARAHETRALRAATDRGDILVAATALVHIARHPEIPRARGEAFLETVLRGLGPGE